MSGTPIGCDLKAFILAYKDASEAFVLLFSKSFKIFLSFSSIVREIVLKLLKSACASFSCHFAKGVNA